MNREPTHHPDTERDAEPRHRREQAIENAPMTGDAFIASIIEVAPDQPTAARLTENYARYGTAFAIYLALDDTDRGSETVEADFRDAFVGYFANHQALIDDTIASFDWGSDLHQLLAARPLLRSMLRFNYEAIWAFASQHYEVVELDRGLYVYMPGP